MPSITIGYTQSDRKNGYSSFTDGYRPGAHQQTVTISIPGDAPANIEELKLIAGAVFVASNAPDPAYINNEQEKAIFGALEAARARGAWLRSLSVGDTIGAGDFAVACQPRGWAQVQVVPCSW